MYEVELPNFVNYFRDELVHLLRMYVISPRLKKDSILLNWKNNACEAMNHIMKLTANWKPSKLPELINNLHSIVKLQYLDMQRSMYGQGNYQLAPWVSAKFKVHPQVWATKSETDKQNYFNKFCSWKQNHSSYVTSSDGQLQIPRTPLTAKKPGQRKRIRKAKTVHIQTLKPAITFN